MANIELSSVSFDTNTEKNWHGRIFLLLVILVTLLGGYSAIAWMRDETQAPLSKITVEGNLYYITTTEIRNKVNALGPLKSFMSQDVDIIQKAILAMPWVNRVSVRKQWPKTLKINITEHQPVAIWNQNKLLSDLGTVFNANPAEVKNRKLIVLGGPSGSEEDVLTAWVELSGILRQTGLAIAELTLNERRSWRIVTANKIRIELGLESRTERLKRFVTLFDQIKASGEAIDYIDLRYDTGLAVGWKKREAAINQL